MAARPAGIGSGRVLLLDMEDRPGFHTTSRSAAMWEPSFGPPIFRALTHASGPFLHAPPDGFSPTPLVTPRGVMMCGEHGDGYDPAEFIARGYAEIRAARPPPWFHSCAWTGSPGSCSTT